LHYDPETGVFTWKITRQRSPEGKRAGNTHYSGYRTIGIDGKYYAEHRLVWMWWHGEFPKLSIDHINGNKSDNRVSNLREASRSQNQHNQPMYKNNSTGYKGVSFCKTTGKWKATIGKSTNRFYLGVFNSPQEAAHAYNKAAIELHGEFAVLNPI
jgi:hypothetical protein